MSVKLPISRIAGALILLLAWTGAARAEWRRAESPNFVLYGAMSEARIRERILLLEEFDRLLRMATSVSAPPAPSKLHVYFVGGLDDLRHVQPSLPSGVAGFYMATPDGIAAFVDGDTEGTGNEVLFHEYTHHFMRQYAPNAYPAWYVEGFAEYYSTARITPQRIDLGNVSEGRGYGIALGTWLPVDRVLFDSAGGLNREDMAQYYAQAWLITHYFFSNAERQAKLIRYLVAARSEDPRTAFRTATGMDGHAFTAELRRYLGRGRITYRQFQRTTVASPPPVTVAVLPRSADDLILFEAALRVGITAANRQPYLERIRTIAARYPEDPLARRVLAHAELLYGDGAAAERLLDSLLAAAPGAADLLYLKGLRHLTAAERDGSDEEFRAARTWFTRAHRADENHFQTLYRYAQSLRNDRAFVSENTSNVLLLAHNLAPQVSEISMNAAALLVRRGGYDQAIALLRPLAADPHDAELARAARGLLDEAERRGRPPAESPPRPEGANSGDRPPTG